MSTAELFLKEIKAIFSNPALLLTVFGGVLLYSVLYPLPYVSQLPREQKVVAVNLDNNQFSRTIMRMIDASPQVSIVEQAHTVEEGRQKMQNNRMAGMLVIPENFYHDLLLGKSPSLSFAGDASYFLVFSTVLEGMAGAGQTLAAQIKVQHMVTSGQALPQAARQYTTIKLRLHALFNEAEGYVNYVIPAIFVLILHQTLFMGIGILCGTETEELEATQTTGQPPYWLQISALKLTLVRASIFVLIYSLLALYYFGTCLMIYDLPRLSSIADMSLFSLIFFFSVAFLGVAAGGCYRHRETATIIALLTSMVIVFTCGFIWPESAIPGPVVTIAGLIPAVPGIKGFVQLNQMGATIQQVRPLMAQIALLGGLFFILAVLSLHYRKIRFMHQQDKN